MNTALIARALLRFVALVLVWLGYVSEDDASVFYTDPDFVALVTLGISEAYFAFDKWRGK